MKNSSRLVQIDNPNNDVAVKVENVDKSFLLPHNKQNSLKGVLINLVGRGDRTYETQDVLQDISFEIKKGEFFGIVGRNGSGKSTLLKMLAGIYTPSKGKITINGSLTPFIELGVGFNPELTGRENVYLNGALLGFSNPEVDKMYDDIVQFAELERFMDQKLKNYSSGMQVRLAFSIAIRAEKGILLLDEVLAVGDAAFQQKCYDYFDSLKKRKQTVIIVTHDMSAVERFCTKAMLIKDGVIADISTPKKIAQLYIDQNNESLTNKGSAESDDGEVRLSVFDSKGNKTNSFRVGDETLIKTEWSIEGVVNVGIALYRNDGLWIYGISTPVDNKQDSIGLKVNLDLAKGAYHVATYLFSEDGAKIGSVEEGPRVLLSGESKWGGLARMDSKWVK